MALSSQGKRIRGSRGQAARRRRLARTHGLCEMCGDTTPRLATVVDHIRPLALGGQDVDSNTRNLCEEHNAEVTAEQFGHRKTIGIDEDGWPLPLRR